MTRAELLDVIRKVHGRHVILGSPINLGDLITILGCVGLIDDEDPTDLRRDCGACNREYHNKDARFCVLCGSLLPERGGEWRPHQAPCNQDHEKGGCDCCGRTGVIRDGAVGQPCHCMEGLR